MLEFAIFHGVGFIAACGFCSFLLRAEAKKNRSSEAELEQMTWVLLGVSVLWEIGIPLIIGLSFLLSWKKRDDK